MDYNLYFEDSYSERQMGMGMIGISGNDLLLVNDIQRAVILEVQAFNYYQN
jgi:hypothetical protein